MVVTVVNDAQEGGAPGGMPGGMPGGAGGAPPQSHDDGPTVEEVD